MKRDVCRSPCTESERELGWTSSRNASLTTRSCLPLPGPRWWSAGRGGIQRKGRRGDRAAVDDVCGCFSSPRDVHPLVQPAPGSRGVSSRVWTCVPTDSAGFRIPDTDFSRKRKIVGVGSASCRDRWPGTGIGSIPGLDRRQLRMEVTLEAAQATIDFGGDQR